MSSIAQPSDAVQAPPSPYEGTRLSTSRHLAIAGFWLATNAHWGALLVVMLPAEIAKMVPGYRAYALGLFTAIGAILAILIPLLVGPISDRCRARIGRRRPYMIWGTVINIIGLAIMALVVMSPASAPIKADAGSSPVWMLLLSSPGFLLFLFGYLVVQFGNNVATAAYMGVLPDVVPSDQRGVASGWYAVMCQVGTLVGAVGVGLALGKASAFAQYGFIVILFLIVGPLSMLGFTEGRLTGPVPKLRLIPYIKSLWINPKREPDFFWVWVTRFLVMLGFYAVEPFINYYLRDVIHSQNASRDSGVLIGLILVAASISSYAGGVISDRIGRKKVVYFATGLMAVFVIAFAFCTTFLSTLVVGSMFGLGFGAYSSVDWALGTDVLPDLDHAAKHMAVWHVSMTLPQSLAPPVTGAIIGAFVASSQNGAVSYSRTGYTIVFCVCAVLFALGAYLLRYIRSVQ